jgi:hypothetical protein
MSCATVAELHQNADLHKAFHVAGIEMGAAVDGVNPEPDKIKIVVVDR